MTLDGAKIRLALPEDDYILGIVSGNPSVVGDVHDDQWQRMYLYDIFGRPLREDVEVPEQKDSTGRVIFLVRVERSQKLNSNYDNTQNTRRVLNALNGTQWVCWGSWWLLMTGVVWLISGVPLVLTVSQSPAKTVQNIGSWNGWMGIMCG